MAARVPPREGSLIPLPTAIGGGVPPFAPAHSDADQSAAVPVPDKDVPEPCMIGGTRYDVMTWETCKKAMRAKRIFDNLILAADLSPGDVRFAVDTGFFTRDGAHYRYDLKTVFLPLGYLEEYGDREAIVAKSLAHEIAHGVQQRLGYLLYIKPLGTWEWHFTEKQLEAHADILGAQIAARAGYPPDLFRKGQEEHYTCAFIRESGGADGGPSHPSSGDRWVNVLSETPRLAAQPPSTLVQIAEAAEKLNKSPWDAYRQLERTFSGKSGRSRLPAWLTGEAGPGSVRHAREGNPFRMLVSPGYFDKNGRAPIAGFEVKPVPSPRIPETSSPDPKTHGFSPGHALRAAADVLLNGSWGDGWVRRVASKSCGLEFDGTLAGAFGAGLARVLSSGVPAQTPPADAPQW